MKNYFKIRQFSLLFDYYCYVDIPEYYACGLFEKHKVLMWFGKEYAHNDHPFRFIFCKCLKWHSKRFKAAMDELPRIMAYNGVMGYDEFCEQIAEQFSTAKNKT